MRSLSPSDASILALLAQVPAKMQDARKRLLERLSSHEAREIGEAVVADKKATGSFSQAARETAAEIKQWASGDSEKRSGARSARKLAASVK
jgi:hypothetical protein